MPSSTNALKCAEYRQKNDTGLVFSISADVSVITVRIAPVHNYLSVKVHALNFTDSETPQVKSKHN